MSNYNILIQKAIDEIGGDRSCAYCGHASIDTLAVKFHVEIPAKYLRKWHETIDVYPQDSDIIEPSRSTYTMNLFMGNDVTITLTYHPESQKYPKPYLRIGVSSLPKVLFGNNVRPITNYEQIEEAIQQVNYFLRASGLLPPVDFGSGILARIDIFYNHYVGKFVQDYIRALSKLQYGRRETVVYPLGVYFKSLDQTSKFYDKHKRDPSSVAEGILRQEITIREADEIVRRMGLHNPTLRDVTFTWLAGVLDFDLQELHLNSTIICERNLAYEMLVNYHGFNLGTKLHGHLLARQEMGREQMKAAGGNNSTVRRWERQIRDAGVSLSLTDKVTLSPLFIERIDVIKNERYPLVKLAPTPVDSNHNLIDHNGY